MAQVFRKEDSTAIADRCCHDQGIDHQGAVWAHHLESREGLQQPTDLLITERWSQLAGRDGAQFDQDLGADHHLVLLRDVLQPVGRPTGWCQ